MKKRKVLSAMALSVGLLVSSGLGAMNVEATANVEAKIQESKQSMGTLTQPSESNASEIVKAAVKGDINSGLGSSQKNSEEFVDYRVIEESVDYKGQDLVKVQQTYKGYDVFGKVIVTQLKDGVVKNTLGDVAKNLNGQKGLKEKQRISKDEARSYVKDTYGEEVEFLQDTAVQKVVYVNDKDKASYGWKVDFSVAAPTFAEGFVILDTKKGDVLLNAVKELDQALSDDAIQYAKGGNGGGGKGGGGKPGSGSTVVGPVSASGVDKNGNTRTFTASEMSDGTYEMADYTRGQGVLTYDADYADLNREYRLYPGELLSSTSTTFSDDEGVSAHYLATSVYDYYQDEYNRNSFDDNGQQVKSVVHAWDSSSTNDPQNWFNAASVNDGAMLIYGDPLAGAYDVAGHEFAHAVTSSESDLIYSGESGALNEGISDVFGVAIEKYVTGSYNWTIGEQSGQVFRSMSDPSSIQFSADLVYPDDYSDYQTLSYDNGGVHFNSSILNKAAFLMAAGGSHNGVSVSGMGEEKMFDVFYYANVDLLTADATFEDLRNAVETVAIDLYGAGSPEYQTVSSAFDATLIP
ncbi:M4 family metallopeptidase [Halobacillus salinus]|uniref:Neutral metalloproteinase n=1 Tax=Halobacillus salinus TaxID=192814 RepID=A0A4Z0H1M0_9BACI|nr:M4 family metallopeptidase [Halobacillus salinus]TGB03784.1 peptidase M4 family protein [Halobacillus salinus]